MRSSHLLYWIRYVLCTIRTYFFPPSFTSKDTLGWVSTGKLCPPLHVPPQSSPLCHFSASLVRTVSAEAAAMRRTRRISFFSVCFGSQSKRLWRLGCVGPSWRRDALDVGSCRVTMSFGGTPTPPAQTHTHTLSHTPPPPLNRKPQSSRG